MGHLEGNFTPVLYIDARFLKVNFLEPSGPARPVMGELYLYYWTGAVYLYFTNLIFEHSLHENHASKG